MIGQVFTPEALSEYMAKLLLGCDGPAGAIRSLDPGAGPGTLTRALIDEATSTGRRFDKIAVVESDPAFVPTLLDLPHHGSPAASALSVFAEDFIDYADSALASGERFSHVIMNPPYRKIGSQSDDARRLKHLGVDAPNYYAAFLWLAIDLLQPGGRLVTVIPRSFTNGPMFSRLRRHMLSEADIEQITSFRNRDLFERDSVLQEVVVVALRRRPSSVERTRFALAHAGDHTVREEHIVETAPSDYLLPMPTGFAITLPSDASEATSRLGELIIAPPFEVHTGEVVDFRNRSSIVTKRHANTVPLIGSADMTIPQKVFPSRFLEIDDLTRRYIHPPGCYVVIKRISPPEQIPRVRARIFNTKDVSNVGVAFENHVNYISAGRVALSQHDAAALVEALAHPETNRQFASLSGSTQVNVSDLRSLRYPSKGAHR